MTTDSELIKTLLVRELGVLCKQGYKPSQANLLRKVPGLTGLTIVGGPNTPTEPKEWKERRDRLRTVLKEVLDEDLPKTLDQRDVEAAIKLFRLDMRQPGERLLGTIHNEIDGNLFPEKGERHFKLFRMDQMLEAVADALLSRENRARDRSSDPAESKKDAPKDDASTTRKRAVTKSPKKRERDTATPKKTKPKSRGSAKRPSHTTSQRRERRATPPAERRSGQLPKPVTPVQLDQSVSPAAPQGRPSPRVVQLAAAAFIGALVIGLVVSAAVWLVNRGEPDDPAVAVSTSPPDHSPAKSQPAPKPSPPTVPPIDFSAHVMNWCYCGDIDTGESQIKIKPRLVNHSVRKVDLRTGANARLVLAIYAPSTTQRDWLSPTRPRYRRFGKWLLVPPNVPGELVSNTSFESHWNRWRLRPHGEYFSPVRYDGDLVFNVPSDLYLRTYNARLAYRLHDGHLYFPQGGAVGQWRGGEDGYNF